MVCHGAAVAFVLRAVRGARMIGAMRIRSVFPAGIALLHLIAGVLVLSAQEHTVWHLGNFDHTAAEFGGRVGNQPVVVDAGAPDAARNWPASQAGTLNASAGPQSHSRAIQFRLDEAPQGTFALDLAVMAGNPRVPRLELDLNGAPRVGLSRPPAELSRRRTRRFADQRRSPGAHSRSRRALRQGGNVLRITAVDDVPDANGDSQITWDALALVRGEASAAPTRCDRGARLLLRCSETAACANRLR